MKVVNEIDIYEIDDKAVKIGDPTPTIKILSHWNRNCLVVIMIEGKEYTVSASDLSKAINNAINCRDW